MLKKQIFFFSIILLISVLCISFRVAAEGFKVFHAFGSLEEKSRLEKEHDIDVDFSDVSSELEKARKIAESLIKRTLERRDFSEADKVIFVFDSIRNINEAWYINYKWEYKNDVKPATQWSRLFKIKIDLKKKIIIHERSSDDQFTGPQ